MRLRWTKGIRLAYLSAAPRVSTRPDAEAGGPRAHVLGVIRAFEELGAEVHPFIVGDRLPRRADAGSERLISGGFVRTLAADIARLGLGAINARRAWVELGRRVDWAYERFATLQSLGWAFRRHGVPWVLETSGLFYREAKEERRSLVLQGVAKSIELRAYRLADVVVCVSDVLRELLCDVGIARDKILVVPNGVDPAFFDPDRVVPAKRRFSAFTIGFVGAVIGWQRLDLLLEAMAGLRTRGLDVAAIIIGDGPARAEWEDQARRLGIGDYVLFTGRVPWDQVPGLVATTDVGYSGQAAVGIGKMYHSPLKIYEYMAMGKPVVASAFEDARRVIDDRRTGFLFRAGDVEDLKQAIADAYQRRGEFSVLGREARARVIAEHSWRSRVKEMIAGVERILSNRSAGVGRPS